MAISCSSGAGLQHKRIRKSVIDGTYKFCSRRYCGQITNHQLSSRQDPEVRATLAAFSDDTAPGPIRVALSHDRSCNLSCPSCRTERIVANKAEQDKLDGFLSRARFRSCVARRLSILPAPPIRSAAIIFGA